MMQKTQFLESKKKLLSKSHFFEEKSFWRKISFSKKHSGEKSICWRSRFIEKAVEDDLKLPAGPAVVRGCKWKWNKKGENLAENKSQSIFNLMQDIFRLGKKNQQKNIKQLNCQKY